MTTLVEMRALFPSAEKCVHLNHAGTSPTARPVANAVNEVLAELMSDDPFTAYKNHQKRQETLRAVLGRMMNATPNTLAFVRNTSHGLAIAAQAVPFRPGESVVVAGNEYPANIYPWMAQAYRGVSTRLVPPHEDGTVSEDDLLHACADTSTRVLAVSWVQWGTGQRMDLDRLGAFCRERGILLVADLVQGLGALRPDLSALPVDIATAGCHKWLLAPGGLGVLYVRSEVFPTLLPTNIGWNAVEESIDWENLHFDRLKPTPERFEEGTPAILATAALLASVRLLESVGFDAVNNRVLMLADYARAALRARGCRLFSPEGEGQKSGIVAFRHPRLSNDEVLTALGQQKVIAVSRGGNLRFSPHAYNSEADIDTAVAAVPTG
jgi:selenocysteine lyase/cysteine desulfurase